jgi:type II secretory pathway pseudopilin PulG
VVVITILAILGTIGFLSISGYSASARDSSRISGIASLTKAMEVAKVKTGYYPAPSSSTGATFSGGTVWNQGTIGDSVMTVLNFAGYSISKKPTDPKYPGVEYAYSLLASGKEYQIACAMEGGGTAANFITPAYADTGDNLSAYVRGDYNGLMAAVKTTGGNTCVLALPSIVLRDTGSSAGTSLDSGAPIQETNLVFHGKANLPKGYAAAGASETQFAYAPLEKGNQTAVGSGITAYCGANLPSSN